jgi:hypothetical protein
VTGGGYIPNLPLPNNGNYYVGVPYIDPSRYNVYSDFIRSAFSYQAYGGSNYGGGYNYTNGGYGSYNGGANFNYSVSCDINVWRWLYGNQFLQCNNYNNYIYDLAYAPASVELTFVNATNNPGYNGSYNGGYNNLYVQGRWIIRGYETVIIPFEGFLTVLTDGRYLIQAGPLAFLSDYGTNYNPGSYNGAYNNFKVYFYETYFGRVSIL